MNKTGWICSTVLALWLAVVLLGVTTCGAIAVLSATHYKTTFIAAGTSVSGTFENYGR